MQTLFGSNKARNCLFTVARRGAVVGVALSALVASAPAFAAYAVKYPFSASSTDGRVPFASLINVAGTYYGTTYYGGQYGYGTVFKLVGVTETVLYSFQGNANGTNDGAYPRGGLTYDAATGYLYGTTTQGGTGLASNCPTNGSCGTVFEILPTGLGYSVIYNFLGGTDGYAPGSGLTLSGTLLYGTTVEGGSTTCHTTYSSCGTVYSVTTAGAETVMHKFGGLSGNDGANPYAAPIAINGKLYGTTTYGGVSCADLPDGCGTIYHVKIAYPYTPGILYKFLGSSDGASPDSGLVNFIGSLWGTTYWGGASHQGMAFKVVTNSGSETNIYNFTGGADGGHPEAGLTLIGKTLYGDTSTGANAGCQYYNSIPGCGTIFGILVEPSYPFTTMYSFTGSTDGGNPFDTLLKSGTSLYGTTYGGGPGSGGGSYGTLFKFTP